MAMRVAMRPRKGVPIGLRAWGLWMPLLCASLGCGTIITKLEPSSANQCNGQPVSPIYSGTRVALACARTSEAPIVWFVDVPLSFTADTGVLPLSVLQLGYLFAVDRLAADEEVLEPEATIAPSEP